MMREEGYRSVRALAMVTGEDHSRIARVLNVLELPEGVLASLREHAGNARVRACFTKKRLRQMVAKKRSEAAMLREIERVTGAGRTSSSEPGSHLPGGEGLRRVLEKLDIQV
jgi:hypothetical protein